ncbi:TPA: adenylosuccinate lyase, partial [Vibrio parahaemolyticus]|nr:adenylosuccinate lyase [Vibrio parahaemolyticus]
MTIATVIGIKLTKFRNPIQENIMELSALTAVSPVDGRYGSKTIALREIF